MQNYKNIPVNNITYYWQQKLISLEQYKYLKKLYSID